MISVLVIEAVKLDVEVVDYVGLYRFLVGGNSIEDGAYGSKIPDQISMKLKIYNYVAGVTTVANPRDAATTWVVSASNLRRRPILMSYRPTSHYVFSRKDVLFRGFVFITPHSQNRILFKNICGVLEALST